MATIAPAASQECDRCRAPLSNTLYQMRSGEERVVRCLRCALTHGPLVRQSLTIALVVGTILTAINQGNIIIEGDVPAALAWKIPLTYAVPYCVATTGAILNARSRL